MNYVGVDLHKESSWFYVMDAAGNRIDSRSIANCHDGLRAYYGTIPRPFTLAVESTYNWYYFVDIAEEYAAKVYLANSYELKAFAKRNKKTDKIDARLIADVLRKGYLPSVAIPEKPVRAIKELLHCRMSLVNERTRNISRLKSLLDRHGLTSTGDFTSLKRLQSIPVTELPAVCQIAADNWIEQIDSLTKRIYRVERSLQTIAATDPDARNLSSIPGIGSFGALLIKSEIGDIARFASFNRLCAYAGLAPRTFQSADKEYHGPLNKNRRKHLQWILFEGVYHFTKSDRVRKEKYDVVAKKKSANVARVVTARDLLKIVYRVLKDKRPYYIASTRTMTPLALDGA
ncbi:MAG: IS110 family RNA-guided transposase [Endomicrobiales bacterium]